MASHIGISYAVGDATDPVGDGPRVIAHVCNDIGAWGRGFVVALSKRWPEPEAEYGRWHRDGEPPFELGAVQLVATGPALWVANMSAGTASGAAEAERRRSATTPSNVR